MFNDDYENEDDYNNCNNNNYYYNTYLLNGTEPTWF